MIAITFDRLKALAPENKRPGALSSLAAEMNKQLFPAGIDTSNEIRHFLAQAAHETASFNSLIEFDSGKRYEGRRDLGNTVPGYGIKYKGRGIFQSTGFSEYTHLTNKCPDHDISFVDKPDLLVDPKWAVWSALIYWNDRNLGDIAMHPDDWTVYSKYAGKLLTPIEYITLRINGGFNGLEQRKIFYERAKEIFS